MAPEPVPQAVEAVRGGRMKFRTAANTFDISVDSLAEASQSWRIGVAGGVGPGTVPSTAGENSVEDSYAEVHCSSPTGPEQRWPESGGYGSRKHHTVNNFVGEDEPTTRSVVFVFHVWYRHTIYSALKSAPSGVLERICQSRQKGGQQRSFSRSSRGLCG